MARPDASRCLALLVVLVMVLPALAVAVPAAAEEETRLKNGFHMFAEVEAKYRQAAIDYPEITAFYDLGELYPHDNGTRKTSHEGRTFFALKISDNPHVNESDEPDILYVGLHHAREWMTTELMIWLMEHILADYGTNDTITQIVDTRELWLFPVLNPDGFVYTDTTDRTWRKNRRDSGGGDYGVDPNRNYGYKWGYDDSGSSPDPGNILYRGPYPFSEPCTQVMRDLALDVGFHLGISFHTYSEVMGFPPAYDRFHVPDYPFFKELGRRQAVHNGYDYGDVADGILYEVNGGFDDWMYFNTSALTFTYEMNSLAQGGFYVDSSLIVPTCTMNYEAALEIAKAPKNLYDMFDGGIRARVIDPRGNPVEGATVNATLIGADTFDHVTGPDGSFQFHAPYERFYEISVSKEGYSSHQESYQVLWRDRFTDINITIKDNVAPVIDRVSASHNGTEGTDFGIGQQVRIDLWEDMNETGLEGVVSIESFGAQYFHRRKPLTWDEGTSSYMYMWDTSGLKPRDDYLVTTELWDIDDNKDKDGVVAGEPDLKIALRDITPPMAPINLSLEAPPGGSTLVVTWEANTDDTEAYTLQRRRGLEGEWTFLINLTKDDTTFTDQGLENDVAYYYRLRAWDKVPLPSRWSLEAMGTPRDLIPPLAVEGMMVTAPPEGGVLELSWDEATDDAAAYLLYKDAGSGFELVEQFPRGSLMYIDEDVENDVGYFYKVSAVDASGNEGPFSVTVLGMPLDVTPPGLPVVEPLPSLTNLSEHQVSGTAEPFATVVVTVDQEDVGRFDVDADGRFSGTIELGNGINRVSFKCFDGSLNPSGSTEPVIVQVDLNPPRVTSTLPVHEQVEVLVTEQVSISVSEALVDGSVTGRLEIVGTGEMVPATVSYSSVTKTISLVPNTQLDKGTEYRVVVDATDIAGNHLTGGQLTFTTERPEEPEPTIGDSTLMLIVLLVAVAAIAGLFIVMRMRKPPEAEPATEGAEWEPGPAVAQEAASEYDPRAPGSEVYEGTEWDEY
ncbi:MAG: Ig-like domain-containing protein [Thermoplasmata archaeon]|nr:MAG: Ig-like domain-containing protein [Thermoplasmata archaeon]